VGESLLLLAQQGAERAALAAAHFVLGEAHLFGSDLPAAHNHLAQAIKILHDQPATFTPPAGGIDLRVTAHTWFASTLWAQGRLDQALAARRAALAYAHQLQQPRTLAFGLLFAGALFDLQVNDLAAAAEKVEAVAQLTSEHNFALYRHIANLYQGYLCTQQGQAARGIAQMQQELATWQTLGPSAGIVQYFLLLARACLAGREVELGLTTVEDALAFAARRNMRHNEAELWRTRGELLLETNRCQEAAASLEHAITVAHQQGALLWELRAAMSLCRLQQRQGDGAEALPLLAAIYARFAEGFAAPDLQAARALLAEPT
jgi:predicted ATPase